MLRQNKYVANNREELFCANKCFAACEVSSFELESYIKEAKQREKGAYSIGPFNWERKIVAHW